jgi:hypothetical protein
LSILLADATPLRVVVYPLVVEEGVAERLEKFPYPNLQKVDV